MYWPIGAPSIYKQEVPKELSTDGEDDKEPVRRSKNHSEADKESLNGVKPAPAIPDSRPHKHSRRNDEQHSERGKSVLREAVDSRDDQSEEILAIRVSRSGLVFATVTRRTLTVWQTWPMVILTAIIRSPKSLQKYGPNVNVLLRPDATRIVLQTEKDHLIDYSLEIDPSDKNYKLHYVNRPRTHTRRRSISGYNMSSAIEKSASMMGEGIVPEATLQFQRIIRLDAGISRAVPLDEELVIATINDPAAVQCIRWSLDRPPKTTTEKLNHMHWLSSDKSLMDLVYDKPMNLYTWITQEGYVYAVRRITPKSKDVKASKSLFSGHLFHSPGFQDEEATKSAINSKFSMIAVSTISGQIYIYTVHDYAGNITLSRKLDSTGSLSTSDTLTSLHYSPDGYCLFAGYDRGWCTWSVYGQAGSNSLNADRQTSTRNGEAWLSGVRDSCWIGGGSAMLLLPPKDNRIWVQEYARSSMVGYLSPANISKTLLQTNMGFIVYQGHEMLDLAALSVNSSLWHQVRIPIDYLEDQWPIKMSAISPDGRYVAVAGQRGLAHYSVHSGRWKTFEDVSMQNEFTVRGGMCWYQHVLLAAVESGPSNELRLYSRELPLDNNQVLHVEYLSAPAVHIAPSGDDSLLVYTRENTLDHYIIKATGDSVRLAKVGQIAFHGIINSPPRVRAVSWVVPDHQLQNGDPSQDVSGASVLFLVDGKLVFLQPSTTESGDLKYDMRVIAHSVEHYLLSRDCPGKTISNGRRDGENEEPSEPYEDGFNSALQDSLWLFDGTNVKMWTDVQDLLRSMSNDYNKDASPPISIDVDFYPLSVLLEKGMLFGVESELTQRRDASFALFRTVARTALFLPGVLRNHLAQYDSPAALHLSHNYQHLSYFPHALEILLHNVLDDERESSAAGETALLPTVLSFLSSFPGYLEVVVQCTRKTEVRYWRTLFAHLPPPEELFETSLQKGSLKTAGGYLLILHTLSEVHSASPQMVRLLRQAKAEHDWDLCKELARFLMALDESGGILREALALVEDESYPALQAPAREGTDEALRLSDGRTNGVLGAAGTDGYFAASATE